MTPTEKIQEVLRIKRINVSKAERKIGVSVGTLSKAIERGGNIHDSTLDKFLRTFHVKRTWWENGKGEIFEENITDVVEENKMRYLNPKAERIPFYDTIAVGGSSMLAEQNSLSETTEMIEPGTFLKGATGSSRILVIFFLAFSIAAAVIARSPRALSD